MGISSVQDKAIYVRTYYQKNKVCLWNFNSTNQYMSFMFKSFNIDPQRDLLTLFYGRTIKMKKFRSDSIISLNLWNTVCCDPCWFMFPFDLRRSEKKFDLLVKLHSFNTSRYISTLWKKRFKMNGKNTFHFCTKLCF